MFQRLLCVTSSNRCWASAAARIRASRRARRKDKGGESDAHAAAELVVNEECATNRKSTQKATRGGAEEADNGDENGRN